MKKCCICGKPIVKSYFTIETKFYNRDVGNLFCSKDCLCKSIGVKEYEDNSSHYLVKNSVLKELYNCNLTSGEEYESGNIFSLRFESLSESFEDIVFERICMGDFDAREELRTAKNIPWMFLFSEFKKALKEEGKEVHLEIRFFVDFKERKINLSVWGAENFGMKPRNIGLYHEEVDNLITPLGLMFDAYKRNRGASNVSHHRKTNRGHIFFSIS